MIEPALDPAAIVASSASGLTLGQMQGGWPDPVYAHVPLIHGPDGAKMSKRHGAVGVEGYRDEEGVLPEALFNYLLRLGWGHGDREEITKSEAIELFDLDGVGKGPARFDIKKLQNLNGHYIREADDARLAGIVADALGPKVDDDIDRTLLAQAMPVLKTRAKDTHELAANAAFLFAKRPLDLTDKAAALLGEAQQAIRDKYHSYEEFARMDAGPNPSEVMGAARKL